ncbi:hypothetical protein PROFUN_02069 [Planoprotostelium fungivorum]|uniref:EF-hand domain-containing protein n=1 Tax=Planoprotostelium fungivorum TaxID=1890364 RepID=A0A2P6NBA3_9EUKA|nr:hypothetical protein PROFUN_02069 [Planoprotostelium fungivorum]
MDRDRDYKASKNVLEQMVKEAFEVFEQDNAPGFVDINDVGSIVRALGMNPSQKELSDIHKDVSVNINSEEPERLQVVEGAHAPLTKLQPKLVQIMIENKMARDDEQKIKRAFQVIDTERKGYIDTEKLSSLLSSHGESFTQEEIEEMFSLAVDPDKGVIFYDEYATLLAND